MLYCICHQYGYKANVNMCIHVMAECVQMAKNVLLDNRLFTLPTW